MTSVPIHIIPNRIGRIVMLASEEILGQREIEAILDHPCFIEFRNQSSVSNAELKFPFTCIGQLQTTLENTYGSLAGRGLSQRVGRACLKYGLREYGSDLGLTNLPFRLLPLPSRIKVGAEALMGFFNEVSDQSVSLDVDERYIYLHIEACPLSWIKQPENPCCSLLVGFLQESLYWVSGGKYFQVEEKNCIASGDSKCTIVIDKTPMS
jgi:predicted hydrocarbon binding protein